MGRVSLLPAAPLRDRHPQQERSRATRNRILAALARLLEKKPFHAVSTAELTRAAHCSMSSLYARFPTKDALLSAFHDRFFDYSAREVGAALDGIDAGGLPIEERVRRMISFFVHSYRKHRGLLRSLVLQERGPVTAGFAARTRAYKQLVFDRALAVVLKGERRAAEPKVIGELRFTLWLVVLGIEHVVLFGGTVGSERIADKRLAEELAKVVIRIIESAKEKA
jgi:AcrR family transcriptional regulator